MCLGHSRSVKGPTIKSILILLWFSRNNIDSFTIEECGDPNPRATSATIHISGAKQWRGLDCVSVLKGKGPDKTTGTSDFSIECLGFTRVVAGSL